MENKKEQMTDLILEIKEKLDELLLADFSEASKEALIRQALEIVEERKKRTVQ